MPMPFNNLDEIRAFCRDLPGGDEAAIAAAQSELGLPGNGLHGLRDALDAVLQGRAGDALLDTYKHALGMV